MTGAGDILGRGLELNAEADFMDHVASARRDNMPAQNLICFSVSDNFRKAICLVITARSAIGRQRKFPRLIRDTLFLELLFGLSDAGNLREGINHARDRVEINVTGLTGNCLSNRDAFFLSLVSEHRAFGHIANRVDAVRDFPVIRLDETAIRRRDADSVETYASV